MSEAILRSKAPKLYISNVMTQPGETSDYDVMDHIQAIHKHGSDFIDYVICSNDKYDDKVLERYKSVMLNRLLWMNIKLQIIILEWLRHLI